MTTTTTVTALSMQDSTPFIVLQLPTLDPNPPYYHLHLHHHLPPTTAVVIPYHPHLHHYHAITMGEVLSIELAAVANWRAVGYTSQCPLHRIPTPHPRHSHHHQTHHDDLSAATTIVVIAFTASFAFLRPLHHRPYCACPSLTNQRNHPFQKLVSICHQNNFYLFFVNFDSFKLMGLWNPPFSSSTLNLTPITKLRHLLIVFSFCYEMVDYDQALHLPLLHPSIDLQGHHHLLYSPS
jgi:hypothetical protein